MAQQPDQPPRPSTEFGDDDLSGAVFRETNLSGVRMRGVLLLDADIDGAIDGLVVNGVAVAPLVEAELDRRHPERLALRPTDAAGLREACRVLDAMWGSTMERAGALPEDVLHRSVDGEWSFTDTLRHLVFVTDAWLGRAVLDASHAFHPLGLPASFTDEAAFGLDAAAAPTYAEVVAARADRLALLRDFADGATDEDLLRVPAPGGAPAWPPRGDRRALDCLRVLLSDEWAHHRFAVRDLDVLTRSQ